MCIKIKERYIVIIKKYIGGYMVKKDAPEGEIQEQYNKMIEQVAKHIFFVPILVVLFVVGMATNKWIIFKIGVAPIVLYMIWFNLVKYRCPKCGCLFDRYQIYRSECKHCHTKFYKK